MKSAVDRFAWALSCCRKVHLRVTPARKLVLNELAAHCVPLSFEALVTTETLCSRCDAATVYRTLMLLKDAEIVRQIGLPQKTSYFVLNAPDALCQFLICRRCGRISQLALGTVVQKLAHEKAASCGFSASYFELEVYGVCPECQLRLTTGRTLRGGKTNRISSPIQTLRKSSLESRTTRAKANDASAGVL
jgi:Fe2+ or Zn2+ uptake regulation protein